TASRAVIVPDCLSVPNRVNCCRLDRVGLVGDRFWVGRNVDCFLRVIASRTGAEVVDRDEIHAGVVGPCGAASDDTIRMPTGVVGGLNQPQGHEPGSHAAPAQFAHVSSPFLRRIADAASPASAKWPGDHPPAGAAGTIAATFP